MLFDKTRFTFNSNSIYDPQANGTEQLCEGLILLPDIHILLPASTSDSGPDNWQCFGICTIWVTQVQTKYDINEQHFVQ